MKKFLTSTRGSALLLALSLAIMMICLGTAEKLGDAPLKAKVTWHASFTVAEPGE